MKKIILAIGGMSCSACSNGLEKFLIKQKGIQNASVNLVMANASIEYDETVLDEEKLGEYIKEAGFESLGIYEEKGEKKQYKQEKIKLIIFSCLAVLLMYISMGHMMGLPSIFFLDMHKFLINYMLSLFFLTIIFLWYGKDILKNGWKNLLHKTPNMDTLVTIGVTSSFIYSTYAMLKVILGDLEFLNQLYFESAAIVIFFIKLGRILDGISKDKTKDAIRQLVQITPNHAIKKVDGKEYVVTIDEIQKGDILICKPGEKIAVDGEIIFGNSHIDESFITGESRPNKKEAGDKVIAGSINYDGYFEYIAEKIGKDSTISEMVRLVVEATNTKPEIAKIADKVSGIFVPVVILLAIITFIIYLILGNSFSIALNTFVTILVIACPCSLGLATPLAIIVSEGVCAKHGILVKKSEVLEKAVKIDTVVFDKTGTLTYGKLKISKVINDSKISKKDLLQLVGSLESKSTHPIGKAFQDYLEENNLEKFEVTDFQNISGLGIVGTVNGKELVVGNSKLLEKYKIKNEKKEEEIKLAKEGNSIVYVAENQKVMALIGVNDLIRENAKIVIKRLKENNIETIMLTGDNEQTANKIASILGINRVIANVLPQEKAKEMKKIKEKKKFVMMCGDGINDSLALANSDIGVSLASGTDIAMDSADVILMKNDLEKILDLFEISKHTIQNIKQNLFWAFFYNVLMIPIAMGILIPFGITINPMIASFAMIISSFTVILNALRLKKGVKQKNEENKSI